jgi:outer membrane lipoprotein carrier protein
MKICALIFSLVWIGAAGAGNVSAQQTTAQSGARPAELSLTEIISRVEQRYDVPGFSAAFHQLSTIKAMDIADEATGKLFVKRPGKMRWEYEQPMRQIIITNGSRLLVHRPEDNQVMLGKSPAFFGDGKGAGFLADIRVLRRKFEITPALQTDPQYYALRLRPLEDSIEVSEITLYVSKSDFTVKQVITTNAYGDQTAIELIDSTFDAIPADDLFALDIPQGADVLTLDEP